jgi:hypothetical protein
MKNPFTVVGIILCTVGFWALFTLWFEVEFTVFAQASTENCAKALGMTGDISTLRASIEVVEDFNPPSVACIAGDKVQMLTPVATTDSLSRYWTVGWVAPCLGVLALAIGLIRSKGWRKRDSAVG